MDATSAAVDPCLNVGRGVEGRDRVSEAMDRVSEARYRVSEVRYRVSGIGCQVSGFRYRVSGIGDFVPTVSVALCSESGLLAV